MSIDREFEQIENQVDRMLSSVENSIGREYGELLKELRRLISDYYAKYSDAEGKLTYQEMVKYDRLQKMEKKLAKAIRGKTVTVAGHIRKGLRGALTTAFERTRGAVEAEIGRKLRGVLKPETINAALQNPVSGLTLNRRLQARRADIILRIDETVTQGLIKGESYRDMAARLKEELEKDTAKAYRIVRTEGHRCQEQGKKESLDYASNQGVKMKKIWRSSQDERVRDSHQHMDGVEVDYEEDFYNPHTGGRGPHPGAMGTAEDDINCRCVFTVEVVKVK